MKLTTKFIVRIIINGLIIVLLETIYGCIAIKNQTESDFNYITLFFIPGTIFTVVTFTLNFWLNKSKSIDISKGYSDISIITTLVIAIGVFSLIVECSGEALDLIVISVFNLMLSIIILIESILIALIRSFIAKYRS